ncbi:MAG: hypothetical protein NVS2B14_14490 [Chamaesiphon sp.]
MVNTQVIANRAVPNSSSARKERLIDLLATLPLSVALTPVKDKRPLRDMSGVKSYLPLLPGLAASQDALSICSVN